MRDRKMAGYWTLVSSLDLSVPRLAVSLSASFSRLGPPAEVPNMEIWPFDDQDVAARLERVKAQVVCQHILTAMQGSPGAV